MILLSPDFSLFRYGLHTRFVQNEDAAFIVQLRTNPKLKLFIHSTSNLVTEQENWIAEYKKREKSREEFYFIFEGSNGEKYGVSRIYNITDTSFTSGSWVFSPEAPFGTSFIGDIISREIAFDLFPDKWNVFDVELGNVNVQRYAASFHAEIIKLTETTVYYRINRDTFNKYKSRYLRFSLK